MSDALQLRVPLEPHSTTGRSFLWTVEENGSGGSCGVHVKEESLNELDVCMCVCVRV